MKIRNVDYTEIQILDKDDTLLVSITDENVINRDDVKVVCVQKDN